MPIQQWSDEIWVAHLADEPSLSEDLVSLITDFQQRDSVPNVVLDLTNLGHLNSSNISQLLRLRKLAIDREAKLRVAAPQDSVWALFLTTGIDKIFQFTADLPSALASLQLDP